MGAGTLLAITAGIYCGLFWRAKTNVERPGDAYWNPTVKRSYESYARFRAAGWATGALAGAALITGTLLLVYSDRPGAERARVIPSVGPGGAGVVLQGRF